MRKVVIMTLGSLGDVQPYVALAQGLQGQGFAVALATSQDFKTLVQEAGVPFLALKVHIEAMATSSQGAQLIKMKISAMKRIWQSMMREMQQSWDDCYQYAQGADLLIYHPKILVAPDIAEKLQIRHVIAHSVPLIASIPEFPFFLLPNTHIGFINKWTYSVMNSLLVMPFKKSINNWRREVLQLPDRSGKPPAVPVLYGFSKLFFPQVKAWPDQVYVTGAWLIQTQQSYRNAELESFLKAGNTPICVTFGSMPMKNPQDFLKKLDLALQKTAQRAIFLSGWSGVQAESTERIFVMKSAPHSDIFRHVSAVIHHGGAGTIAACVHAGKPMVICPFTADQPFWAKQMKKLGLACGPLPEKAMSAKTLADHIQKITHNSCYTEKASRLASCVAQENGIAQAVQVIHTLLNVPC